ncbi:serine/threonine-protein kinase [Microbacterium sp. ASV49]|uniref:non-specific serine/threonine protein kinase n=1 Tax=Microbacterium candidum TaxID=3041922 RepID=A0ABT7N063_9MICO|nr:serine/threonine-protein kinase [Microbacterium sp. ASV49]MDL9980072.1 serine/threonine-protein kinase [Microbacterium sp. ASV49]
MSQARVNALRQRPDFPDAVGEIAQGQIWDLDVIRAWAGSGLRQTKAGRPKAEDKNRTLGGRFVLEYPEIGSGGFANVYRAADKKTDATVAIKVLRDIEGVGDEAINRFRRELRLMESLEHANVVSVLAQGETDAGEIWYAMPLAQGSLSDYVKQVTGNPPQIVEIMRQISAGLAYIHRQGIYHRDLKTANVLRLEAREGESDSWAIADFGLAVTAERESSPLTSSLRQGLGSWVYTAPEQWNNARSADVRSDIYSLGKILQELTTGAWPVNVEIPPGVLRPVIEKAIANAPDQRYQSVAELMDALERALGTQIQHQDWESRTEQAERLRDRMLGRPTDEDLNQTLDWALALNENDAEDMRAMTRVLPWMNATSIQFLRDRDRAGFARVIERFCKFIGSGRFSFEYCDTLANFLRRVTLAGDDPKVTGFVAAALTRLGAHHNRWHVQDVLIRILQDVQSKEAAAEVVEALRNVPRDEVQWAITDFTVRSLPVAVRNGVGPLIRAA